MQPDNAQNWPRHQLAELGILGSAPWLLWFVLFTAYVLRFRRSEPPGTLTLRGMLIGLGAISMFSMPGQAPAVAITFWAFANWLRIRSGPVEPARPLSRTAWSAVGLIVVLATVSTTVVADMGLRPPQRKVSGSAAYSYGFGPPDGEGFRPGAARAVSVVNTGARWMLVTAIYEPHAAGEVVDLRLTVNGRSLLKGRLSSSSEVSSVFEVSPKTRRVLLEASVVREGESQLAARMDSAPRFRLRWTLTGTRPASADTAGR